MKWYLKVLKKYATFEGRARRSEYWYFFLFNFLISFAVALLDGFLWLEPVLFQVYALFILIPSIAVTCRRLHDTGRSGWYMLLYLIPIVGPIVLFVLMIKDSSFDRNKYGPNPKRQASV